jgi:hypothetical protein|tara:strand:- start:1710 stop:1892 length:183 start_codon:yes stop_codon:yes gene_type:complete
MKEIEDSDFCNECEEMFNYPDGMFDVPDHLRRVNHPDDPRNVSLRVVVAPSLIKRTDTTR